MSTPLKVLGLTVFTENRLRNGRVYDVETLRAMSNRDILAIPDMGKKALKEVLEALDAYASDISQEPVDETAKDKHDLWIAAACLKSTVESAIKAGDWKVDGACDPTRDLAYLADCLANPKREWVWLTKDDVDSWELPVVPTVFQFAKFVEAKLKEMNA
jgi:hypothetical protein